MQANANFWAWKNSMVLSAVWTLQNWIFLYTLQVYLRKGQKARGQSGKSFHKENSQVCRGVPEGESTLGLAPRVSLWFNYNLACSWENHKLLYPFSLLHCGEGRMVKRSSWGERKIKSQWGKGEVMHKCLQMNSSSSHAKYLLSVLDCKCFFIFKV